MDESLIPNQNSISAPKSKEIEANIFISTGELERKELGEQVRGSIQFLRVIKIFR